MNPSEIQQISGSTSLVGVIGWPVSHSLSPAIHNAAFQAMQLDWCYLPIPCKAVNLELVLNALREINFKGLNITIPHKIHAIDLCEETSRIARDIGAINTLTPNKQGGWYGSNTDMHGFLSPLGYQDKWKAKKACIIGCGGSAKAVISGLESYKFKEIIIVGRTERNLTNFLDDYTIKRKHISNRDISIKGIISNHVELANIIKDSDLIVNTTPVGMSKTNAEGNQEKEMPMGKEIWANLQPSTILYDLIYTPKTTPWLRLGMELGCITINGLDMLIEQAAESLRLWSGINNIPIDVMREAAEKKLID